MRPFLRKHALAARLVLLLSVLLVSACGQEAPPRAERATPIPSSYATRTPTSVTLPTVAVDTLTPVTNSMGDSMPTATTPQVLARALGNPNAPITVIEYSDYQ